MKKSPSIKPKDVRRARKERAAREAGKSLPHYAGRVTEELSKPKKSGSLTPSKRG